MSSVLHIMYKVHIHVFICCAQIWRGRTIVYDPARITLEQDLYPHHVSPNDIVFATHPRIFLREAEHAFIQNGLEHNFTLLHPYPLAADTLIKEGQPWVLQMCMDDAPRDFEFYFSINNWQYTSLLTSSVINIPRYMEPYSVCWMSCACQQQHVFIFSCPNNRQPCMFMQFSRPCTSQRCLMQENMLCCMQNIMQRSASTAPFCTSVVHTSSTFSKTLLSRGSCMTKNSRYCTYDCNDVARLLTNFLTLLHRS